jgi:hypothetical protein
MQRVLRPRKWAGERRAANHNYCQNGFFRWAFIPRLATSIDSASSNLSDPISITVFTPSTYELGRVSLREATVNFCQAFAERTQFVQSGGGPSDLCGWGIWAMAQRVSAIGHDFGRG